jgi:multidrug efflux system membrane fusion protein
VTLTTGIKEGDKIISGNLQKIFPGAPVQPLDGGGS